MSNITFNCPQCGEHLAVDAKAAGTTVACPKCGQAILVPQMARFASRAEKPKAMKWVLVAASAGGVALLAAGGLIWHLNRWGTAPPTSLRIPVTPRNDGLTTVEPAALTTGAAANRPLPMTAPDAAKVIAPAVEPAQSAHPLEEVVYQTHFETARYHPGPLANEDGWELSGGVSKAAAQVIGSDSGQSLLICGLKLEPQPSESYVDVRDIAQESGLNLQLLSSNDYEMRCSRPLHLDAAAAGARHIRLSADMELSLGPDAKQLGFHAVGMGLVFPGVLTNRIWFGRWGRLCADTYSGGFHRHGAAEFPAQGFHRLSLDCDLQEHRVSFYLDRRAFCALPFIARSDPGSPTVFLAFSASRPNATTLRVSNLVVTAYSEAPSAWEREREWRAEAETLPIRATPRPQIALRAEPVALQSFSDHPLFGPDGPSKDDVLQGRCGDCFYMALLAALAEAHPDFIKKVINDVGDGTYIVHLVRLADHHQFAIRINGELWAHKGRPWVAAKIGPSGAIWPALLEKAYAATRKPPYDYEAAGGGCEDCGTLCFLPVKSLTLGPGASRPFTDAYWDSHEHWVASEPVSAQEVADWFNHGEPEGRVREVVDAYCLRLLGWLKRQRDAGKAVEVGTWEYVSDQAPLIPRKPDELNNHKPRTDTYRRTQHGFTLVEVKTDEAGKPTGLVLRNAWGNYVSLKDMAHIYFCIGMAFDVEVDPEPIPFLAPSAGT